ncbi:MAG: DEAD/DEAH box helicase [Chlamydiales bacterium]|nr:DEAD/DEAH box helicase [Chlamydiales bacterium]
MTFQNLGLHPKIVKAVAYPEPSQIQLQAIPEILKGFDIRASAQTGTGKTAAFLLPALNLLTVRKEGRDPRILVLAPTRELAMQITTQAENYSKFLQRTKVVCIVGGVPYHKQIRDLSKPHDILVATPGRLIDFMKKKQVDLSNLDLLVLDEADRMLDMGFAEPVEEIIQATPSTRQTLLFSATLEGVVMKLSDKWMHNPLEIKVKADAAKNDHITQTLHYVDSLKHKNRLLEHILAGEGVNHTIIFTSTKRHSAQLVEELQEKGHSAAALHGDLNQRQRTRTIGLMRKGKVKILVATDVAARGLDVPTITHVINFDLPTNPEDYIHRIGRTGRAGATGSAFSFVQRGDGMMLKRIEKLKGSAITVSEIAGLEPSMAEPKRERVHKKASGPRQFARQKASSSQNFKQKRRSESPNSRQEKHSDSPSFGRKQRSNSSGFGKKKHSESINFREEKHSDSPSFGRKQRSNSSGFGKKKHSESINFREEKHSDSPSFGRKQRSNSSGFGKKKHSESINFREEKHSDSPSFGRKQRSNSSGFEKKKRPNFSGFGRKQRSDSPGFGRKQHSDSPSFGQKKSSGSPGYGRKKSSGSPNFGQKKRQQNRGRRA